MNAYGELMSILISAAALLVALIGVVIAWRARGDSKRSADAAAAAEHRAARPRLLVEADGAQPTATEVIYRVLNVDGPDLESVVVSRPVIHAGGGGVVYPVAATGRANYGDAAEIGPIPLAGYGRFTLALGSAESLPTFRVRITCADSLGASWEYSELLDTPRSPAARRAAAQAEQREREAHDEADRQLLEEASRVSYQLFGGAGRGIGDTFEMTSLHVTVRNDSNLLASSLRVVVGDDDFVWFPPGDEPLAAGEKLTNLADLPPRSLPQASQSEATRRPVRSYPSTIEFTLSGRQFIRTGDGEPRQF